MPPTWYPAPFTPHQATHLLVILRSAEVSRKISFINALSMAITTFLDRLNMHTDVKTLQRTQQCTFPHNSSHLSRWTTLAKLTEHNDAQTVLADHSMTFLDRPSQPQKIETLKKIHALMPFIVTGSPYLNLFWGPGIQVDRLYSGYVDT